jgi:hypothetical protein
MVTTASLVSGIAVAQAPDRPFTPTELAAQCVASDPEQRGRCLGFLQAVYDHVNQEHRSKRFTDCTSGVTLEQFRTVVVSAFQATKPKTLRNMNATDWAAYLMQRNWCWN